MIWPPLTEIHQILLGGNVIIVEGLTTWISLTARRVCFGALPLKIEAGDRGAFVEFAIEGVTSLLETLESDR